MRTTIMDSHGTNRHWNKVARNIADDVPLIIDLNGDGEPYDPHVTNDGVTHLGQRKLLISEIYALTTWYIKYKGNPTVIYAGAAPGFHIIFLAILFPKARFILYDSAPFDARLLKQSRDVFEFHNRRFTSDDAFAASRLDNTLFISDIRSGRDDFEAGVADDMVTQREWVAIMRPALALLKFRLPYNMPAGSSLEYLDGQLLYSIWSKPMSGESRLLVTPDDIDRTRMYDVTQYESVMFKHNKSVRGHAVPTCARRFEQFLAGRNNRYCACFDCVAELSVFERYLRLSNSRRGSNFVQLSDVTAAFFRWWRRPLFPKIISKDNIIQE